VTDQAAPSAVGLRPRSSGITREPGCGTSCDDLLTSVMLSYMAETRRRTLTRRYARLGDRPGWSSKVRENKCSVTSHRLRVRAQDRWPAAPVDLICRCESVPVL